MLLHPDDALRLIDSIDLRLPPERVALAAALGRIPLRDAVSLLDQPPFDKATMDGFAYAIAGGGLAETGDSFALVGLSAAGAPPSPALSPGQCVRIMTGAPVPEGACAVHRVELAEVEGDRVRIAAREIEANIRRRGDNSRAGAELFPKRPLRPQDLALLAANGIVEIEVAKRPRAVVVSTGDELEAAGDQLAPGRIYDSNGPLLVAQAAAFGCEASFGGIVDDDEEALREAIASAAERADLVLVSGGVSAGDFDFVPRAFERCGFSPLFRGLAMRPGRPAMLARRGAVLGYGMPGNPVAAFVNFEVLVKPLLRRISGHGYEARIEPARLASALSRRETDRVEFLPVSLARGVAAPLRYTGSTMLDVLARADAFVRLEIGQADIAGGTEVDARRI